MIFALVVFDQVRIEPARIVAAVDEIDKVPAHDRLIQTARRLKRHAAKRFYELRVRSLRLQQRQRPGVICADARENLFQPGAEITFRQSGHPLGISVQPFFQHTSVVRNGVHVSRAAHNVGGFIIGRRSYSARIARQQSASAFSSRSQSTATETV